LKDNSRSLADVLKLATTKAGLKGCSESTAVNQQHEDIEDACVDQDYNVGFAQNSM